MNLEEHPRYAPRRTHSFDSYDSLDRLEKLRQMRNDFFANRSKYEQRPRLPLTPPPIQRSISPTSKLIQDFTGKLAESSITSNHTTPGQPPIPPERSPERKLKVLSLDSPRKVVYKTTCHVFPTFNAPEAKNQETKFSEREKPNLPRTTRQRSFNSIDDILQFSESKRNSLAARNDSTIKPKYGYEVAARPFLWRGYQEPSRLINDESDAAENSPTPERQPVNEPVCVKEQVGQHGNVFATPFQEIVDVYTLSPERKEAEKLFIESSESTNKNPVPYPRIRNQPGKETGSPIPQSYPSFMRQQSGKEWRPVEAPFARASSTYSSLPLRKSQEDRSRYLISTLDQSDSPTIAPTPTERNPYCTRRSSAGSVQGMKMRSKASNIPVKDLIQKFSKG